MSGVGRGVDPKGAPIESRADFNGHFLLGPLIHWANAGGLLLNVLFGICTASLTYRQPGAMNALAAVVMIVDVGVSPSSQSAANTIVAPSARSIKYGCFGDFSPSHS